MSAATGPRAPRSMEGHPQSLAHGSLGQALRLSIEAHTDLAAGPTLQKIMRRIGPLVNGPDASLYYGTPAAAFVLTLAPCGYQRALDQLDDLNEELTRSRLAAAHHRINRRHLAAFGEYDVFRGLTGITLLWLQRRTRPDLVQNMLKYLVRLTEPVNGRPGWMAWHRTDNFSAPGPHGNNGLAHGISAPLSVLSLAWLQGITVPGHAEAIERVLSHLDAARRENDRHCWWDRWDGEARTTPPPLSWCYGTPGLARAQQLAALALNDPPRHAVLEQALLQQLADDHREPRTDPTICHGTAGILRTCQRIAKSAVDPQAFTPHIERMRAQLALCTPPQNPGTIDGIDGVELAIQGSALPWDAFLALT